jgi:hypothetical protein
VYSTRRNPDALESFEDESAALKQQRSVAVHYQIRPQPVMKMRHGMPIVD